MSEQKFVTGQEIIIEARRRLPRHLWDFLSGAAGSETSMQRNRFGFDSLAFRPRVLRNMTDIDSSTEILGHTLKIPVLLAPIGEPVTLHPDGAMAIARAAGAFGTVSFTSSLSSPGPEEIGGATDGAKFFQLYVRGDLDWVRSMLDRARGGFCALAVTVDSAFYGLRERQMMHRWAPPGVRAELGRPFQTALDWDIIDRIREIGDMPFMLKGIATAEDAAIAVEHGVDVIYVSNHGGRQLDHCIGTMEALPEIVDAVGGKAKIVLDGGVTRGSDVIKAIALGADAVGIGKLLGWALAADGEQGIIRMLEILESEIRSVMGLIGTHSIAEIDRACIREVRAIGKFDELSAFTHLPEWVREKPVFRTIGPEADS